MTNHRTLFASLILLTACGGAAQRPAETPPTAEPSPAEAPALETADAGVTLTPAECEQRGGHVVGDIGDGAIHRPDYRCPGSGEPPIGRIQVEAGEPMPIEGAVCCL